MASNDDPSRFPKISNPNESLSARKSKNNETDNQSFSINITPYDSNNTSKWKSKSLGAPAAGLLTKISWTSDNQNNKSSNSARSKPDIIAHPHSAIGKSKDDNDLGANPFKIPNEDVFVIRDREKADKQKLKEKLNSVKIWDKAAVMKEAISSNFTNFDINNNPDNSNHYANQVNSRNQFMSTFQHKYSNSNNQKNNNTGFGVNGGSNNAFVGRRREKENMSDFIAKKRDMFLIQMSLDTKRAEIQKLEEKARMKEEALQKSELMLEEDAMRFDAFLKENDRKAHEALKRADAETKEKQEKVMEIKKLNQEIAKVENEMSKYEEQLTNCLKYKEFLDSLTPQEFLDDLKKKREIRKAEKRAKKLALNQNSNNNNNGSNTPSNEAKEENKEDDDDDDDEENEPMYFQRPEQLLDIFAQLEERNLFLIQNVQETEEALEELKQKFESTERDMEKRTKILHSNIADLKAKIAVENEKAEALKRRARANMVSGNQQALLNGLSEKVREVYADCLFDADSHTDTLDMLRDIESWLERLLSAIKVMDPVKVEAAEKKKNQDRRNEIRRQKKAEQQRAYEERLAKSTARAKAEVIRRSGKQVMFRSPPIRRKKKKEDVVERDEEAEELKRFFT